jgi:GNAT superfamily N-acetyltransferase
LTSADDFEIRPALEADLGAILQMLERDSFSFRPAAREKFAKAFSEVAAHPDSELMVVTLAGEVVATFQLNFIPGLSHAWRAQLESVRVRHDLRNHRIGTRLMEWVIARARERGCRLVQLTTNAARKDAQRFYQRLGFKPSHIGMKLYLE